MATASGISILKNLFLKFFNSLKVDNKSELSKYRFNDRAYAREAAKLREARLKAYENGKATILGLAATVTSLAGVIGQPGVDAFNEWIATYAGGTGPITSEAVKALQAWYNQYLKPLT
jgi:hypothetical protein